MGTNIINREKVNTYKREISFFKNIKFRKDEYFMGYMWYLR